MTVGELIAALGAMPVDALVLAPYDGGVCHVEIASVWESRGGAIMLAALDEPVYHDADRPVGAPTEADDAFWCPRDGRTK